MAYTDQAALADDPTFRSTVRVALATAAVQVMGEDKASYSDVQYGKRQALAYEVLRAASSGIYASTLGISASGTPGLGANFTD